MDQEHQSDAPGGQVSEGRSAIGGGSGQFEVRLGVVGASPEWLVSLNRALLVHLPLQLTAVSDLSTTFTLGREALEWDVALAFLSVRSLQPLTDILACHDRLGCPELVAIAESANDSAVLALREFGVERVISQDVAAAWLADSLRPLASMAVAKRLLRRSRRALGEVPRPDPLLRPDVLPLSVAEGRFREAYLRAMMATAGSRARAAKGAGIPYRTFCYMLERYGIADLHSKVSRLERP